MKHRTNTKVHAAMACLIVWSVCGLTSMQPASSDADWKISPSHKGCRVLRGADLGLWTGVGFIGSCPVLGFTVAGLALSSKSKLYTYR